MDKSDLILAAIEQLGARLTTEIAGVNERIDDLSTQVNGRIDGLSAEIAGLKVEQTATRVEMNAMKAEQASMKVEQTRMKQVMSANHLKVMGRIDQLSDQLERHLRHAV